MSSRFNEFTSSQKELEQHKATCLHCDVCFREISHNLLLFFIDRRLASIHQCVQVNELLYESHTKPQRLEDDLDWELHVILQKEHHAWLTGSITIHLKWSHCNLTLQATDSIDVDCELEMLLHRDSTNDVISDAKKR